MKFKITAVNTKNPSEKFEYELEGESVDSFKYFDEAEGKFFHPKEVLNNKMREINNNLMLNDSPIFTIKKAGEKAIMIIEVDSRDCHKAVEQIQHIPHLHNVNFFD